MAKYATSAAAAVCEDDSMSLDPSGDDCRVEVEGREPFCGELWKACAGGPHLCIPKEGEKVFYFPQGHIEQVEPFGNQGGLDMQFFSKRDIPFKIPCLVVNAQFLVEAETDELIVRYTLIPSNEEGNAGIAAGNNISSSQQNQVCIYRKALTASDISTHGGFALEKRFADECLPLMDMSRDPPAQIVVMKDLNGQEWSFLHIYHTELKQHLLTTGWDKFVADKMLVEGDKIVYLRDANGELRIGIHRDKRGYSSNYTISKSYRAAQCAILSSADHAVLAGTLFSVFYRPWASDSCFLVPYDKYLSAIEEEYPIMARIKMLLATDEAIPRFAVGTVVETGAIDPIRWPGSEWRCLKVIWDAPYNSSVMGPLPERVSPWEIELLSPRKSIIRERSLFRLPPYFIVLLVLGILGLIIIMIYVHVPSVDDQD